MSFLKYLKLQIHIRLTLDALPVLARNDPVTEAVSLWIKIRYFLQKCFLLSTVQAVLDPANLNISKLLKI